jgi:glycosyltransferase involved in cell wall biosynthesis
MKLLVVNQYYAPDRVSSGEILSLLCEGLAKKGIDTHVVCGQPSYRDDSPSAPGYEERDNLRIWRVSTGGAKGRRSMVRRAQGYLGFLFSAYREVKRRIGESQYDAVLTLSNPPVVGLLGVSVRSKGGAKYVYVVHDIHPDILLRSGRITNGLAINLWNQVNSIIFRNTDAIVVLGSRMARHLAQQKSVPLEKIHVIPNWPISHIQPLPRDNAFRLAHWPHSRFTVLYAGNMGISHNLVWLIDAATQLPDVTFVFAGEGQKLPMLQELVQRKHLSNIVFLPYQEARSFNEMLCAADVCVVALEPELAGLAVPSNTYSALAAGRSVLALTSEDDDVADTVREWQCGWVARDSSETVKCILEASENPDTVEEAGRRARLAFEQAYSLEQGVAAYADLLTSSP